MSPRKKRILIADDDPEVVRVIALELEAAGFEVSSAVSGQEALSQINQSRPDLVILDYAMPKGNGLFVISKLKTALETFTIPVIILTAMDSGELRKRMFKLSAHAYLTKPVAPGRLAEKVRELLGASGD